MLVLWYTTVVVWQGYDSAMLCYHAECDRWRTFNVVPSWFCNYTVLKVSTERAKYDNPTVPEQLPQDKYYAMLSC